MAFIAFQGESVHPARRFCTGWPLFFAHLMAKSDALISIDPYLWKSKISAGGSFVPWMALSYLHLG